MRAIIRGRYCWPHINGVPHGMPAFYNASCVTCEAKLASGKVTRDAPPSQSQVEWKNRTGGKARQRAIAQSKIWKEKLSGAEPR